MIDIAPDIEFKKELKKISGSSLNECIQCGNCSAVCTLAPADKPFPRKEMIWAAWGLKDKLIANPDIWLCHQCGDCSASCPRGVNPADILASVRQLSYKYYARPAFMGRMLSDPRWLPLAIVLPVIIITSVLLLAGTFTIPEGPVIYSKFFPHPWLNGSFSLITLMVYGMSAFGFIKFSNDLKLNFPDAKPTMNLFRSLLQLKNEVLTHSKFGSCKSLKSRRVAHFLVFYGFLLLLLVTIYAIVAAVTHNYPLSITNPFKIIGNMASLMLIVGLSIYIINRLVNRDIAGNSNYSDWLLLVSFFLLTVSGVIVELARFNNWHLAYHFYFFHLICVWFVIIYLPYTKFAHMIYRLIALSYANSIGRK